METEMKTLTICLAVVLLMSAFIVQAQDSKIEFSGEWVLNKENSDLPEGRGGRRGGMVATKRTVLQEENLLTVQSFRQNRDGEEVSTELKYTLDGKERENTSNRGTQVSTAEWSSEGDLLTISSTMTMSRGDREFTIESTADWSFDEGVLTIETIRSTPMGEMQSRAVYDKGEK